MGWLKMDEFKDMECLRIKNEAKNLKDIGLVMKLKGKFDTFSILCIQKPNVFKDHDFFFCNKFNLHFPCRSNHHHS